MCVFFFFSGGGGGVLQVVEVIEFEVQTESNKLLVVNFPRELETLKTSNSVAV